MPFYTGLLYYIVRPLARIGIWIFFRKIDLLHTDRIPKGKPVLLASNHPTGFMEPCIMAVFLWRPLYFLVRGDFFRKPIFNFLLRALNMIPIFRGRDGNFRDLKSNFNSFSACHDAFRANKTIMIYPEGNAVLEKRLRPLKKGISRLAYGTLEAYPELEDLYIVPVGVSYTYPDQPRNQAMISCGEPLSTRGLLEKSEYHFGRFDRRLREELTQAMQENLVHIEREADEELVEWLQRHFRLTAPASPIFPVLSFRRTGGLDREQGASQLVNKMAAPDKETLQKRLQSGFEVLEQYRLPQGPWQSTAGKKQILRVFWLSLTALPVLAGYLFALGPYTLAARIQRTKVKKNTFLAPVLLAANIGLFLVYYLFWAILSLITGHWEILAAAIGLGILAYGSILWRESYRRFRAALRYKQLSIKAKEDIRLAVEYMHRAVEMIKK